MTEMQTAQQTYTDLAPAEKVMFQAILEMAIILLKTRQETQPVTDKASSFDAAKPHPISG